MPLNFYERKSHIYLKQFDRMAHRVRKYLRKTFEENLIEIVLEKSRSEFEKLLPRLPFIGGKNNIFTPDLILSAMSLALYRAFLAIEPDSHKAKQMVFQVFIAEIASRPPVLGWLSRKLLFSKWWRRRYQKQAATSQQKYYPEDYVIVFIEGDGKTFDYGLDFHECATCKLFNKLGASELTPVICASDALKSRRFGWGLIRTKTLAEGYERCDFRFKRGAPTNVSTPAEIEDLVNKIPDRNATKPGIS